MTRSARSHVAVLLAAGGSERLGHPKQLLTRDGEPLVHRTARLMAETGPRRLLVVLGARRDAVAAALGDIACEQVVNQDWQHGRASSLHAVARTLSGEDAPVLLCACDQPALTFKHLASLLSGAATSMSGCAATVHGDVPGVPAVVPGAWFAQVDGVQGDAGFGAGLRALPRHAVHLLDAPELQLDIDTPDDLRRARAAGLLDAPG